MKIARGRKEIENNEYLAQGEGNLNKPDEEREEINRKTHKRSSSGEWELLILIRIISNMLEEVECTLNQLPEEVLANILRRLTPPFLATSRCVCKPWCTIIDTRRLAQQYLTVCHPEISLALSDHCNGLLLLDDYVVNPATYQWVQLPPFPSPHLGTENFFHKEDLVFDPAVSPHYEVFLIPFACARSGQIKLNPATEELEWPLSPCILHVFSSRTKKWEERSFVREGEAAGTVADMRLDGSYSNHYHNSVYWRGALYVHCQTNFVMRLSLLDGKYQVIKPPLVDTELIPDPNLYLGKSQKGLYCALDDHYVYILDESYGKMEWFLKTSICLRYRKTDRPKPWTLQDIKCIGSRDEYQDEWDSGDDNVIHTEGWGNRDIGGYIITLLGFYPYREVVFE
ncbi:unnamed protein product [Miscanthus lutarioriparius]|uniref:F-box domain-containing protein n=1 Tax=Miscanthus lutarioriparius TaxID=422564 RepID=A0A811P516_9POAL|nr:unnamed protein product [Miscanthus lutarioriparius]